ncbi:MAG: helix-hairpin-helix domain-containing protein [Clostridia bacterium]|nr:helix-hairpin-helix domain-containing protein [Clostridia bacterium]
MDKKELHEIIQRGIICSIAFITLIYIMAYVVFKDTADVNIYQITTYKNVYNYVPDSEKLDINKATKEDFMKFDGIGEVIAERIIEYREENGGFNFIEDLQDVKGVSKNLYNRIKDYIIVIEEDP